MMTPRVKAELEKEASEDTFATKVLNLAKDSVRRSRTVMSAKYDDWDLQDEVYRGVRSLDDEDIRQKIKGNTVKMVVPNTFAQVMSFTSFLFLMFKQNNKFFQNDPTGPEDYGKKMKDCDQVTNRDWNHSYGSQILFQNLLDTARFGTAPMEVSWTKSYANVWVVPEQPMEQTLMGVAMQTQQPGGYQKFVKFEGNTVRNVSPYRWFPDTGFPLCDFRKGAYCYSEEDFTMGQLRTMEVDGEVAGIKHLQGFKGKWQDERGGSTRMSFDAGRIGDKWDADDDSSPVIVTKGRHWIVPKTFTLSDGKPLGDESFQVLYTIWYGNDNRIIRFERAEEWHQELNYGLSQFTPDMHHTVTMGLADLVYRLQDVISWFINSHITSVRRVMQNRMVINKNFIEPKSYDSEGDIMIRTGVGRIDPKLVAAQLQAQDVTQGHMGDVDMLGKIMQMISGVNDNAMGQYNSGRRSASEARVVTAGAAGRMKTHAHLMWEACFGRIGRMMLSNSRQTLSFESFARIIGGEDPAEQQLRYQKFKGTPAEIVAAEDYQTFDSTLASERGFMAQNLQELLGLLLQANPMAAQQIAMQIDPLKLVGEMQYLRDGIPIEALRYDQGQAPNMAIVGPNGMPIPPGATPTPPVQ